MKEVYVGMRKQFPILPSYALLNKEFEVETIEKDSFPLRSIANRMVDHVRWLKDILRPALEPDTNISSGLFFRNGFLIIFILSK